MLGVFAEFETAIRKERQMEGISAAKAAGVYKGRPASIKPAAVAALKAEGLGATEIAKRLKIGRQRLQGIGGRLNPGVTLRQQIRRGARRCRCALDRF
jgi:DNA invertase Pin-like site-specific DNA recombinase